MIRYRSGLWQCEAYHSKISPEPTTKSTVNNGTGMRPQQNLVLLGGVNLMLYKVTGNIKGML